MRKILLLVSCIILIAEETRCQLDFSQFYLPPCCYISPQDQFSGYASQSKKSSVNTKREIDFGSSPRQLLKSESRIKTDNEDLGQSSNTSKKESKTRLKSEVNTKVQFYSFVVPISEILVVERNLTKTTENSTITQITPPTIGRILLQGNQNRNRENEKHKRDSQNMLARSKLLENILTLELDNTEGNKPIVGKKSLANRNFFSDSLKREQRSPSTSQIVETYARWDPKRTQIKSGSKPKSNFKFPDDSQPQNWTDQNSNYEKSASENIKQQVVRKIPSSWVKHLRRALYQSITDKYEVKSDEEASQNTNNNENEQRNSRIIKFPETWQSLKSARIQFVDKTSQLPSDVNGVIYLPPGEGPVVAGVLVNSQDGGLQLRVASELHFANEATEASERQDNCRCYLLGPGEILMAYWSISRIFKDNGQPSLQYLVYPLPYSVPTPPELLPFSNDIMFLPSPIDPLTNYYENVYKVNKIGEHQNPHILHNPPKYFDGRDHPVRHPKLVHEIPNGHHRLEMHFPPQQRPLPPPPPTSLATLSEGQLSNAPTKFDVDNGGQYQPEFMEQYPAPVPFQNHLNQHINHNRGNMFHSIPYTDLNVNGPRNYEAILSQIKPSNPPPEPTYPTNYDINERLSEQRPGLQIQSGPDPTALSVQDAQVPKPPAFPTSIQDIISPLPHNGEESLPPVKEVPQPLQQTERPPIPPPTYFPYMYNPVYNPQEYYNQEILMNLLHNMAYQQRLQQPQLNLPYTGQVGKKASNKNVRHKHKQYNQHIENEKDVQHNTNASRPYVISNILDNEKKYYPIRQSSKSSNKYDLGSTKLYRHKLVQDIESKGGYILDF